MLCCITLFSSQLNYGALIWGTTTVDNTKQLLLLQKRIVRIICRVPYLRPTSDLFKKLDIIRIDHAYNFKLCRYYKLEVTKNHRALVALSRLEKNFSPYPTRHTEEWKIRKCRTNYGNQMVKYRLPTMLNDLAKHRNIDVLSVYFKDLRSIFA